MDLYWERLIPAIAQKDLNLHVSPMLDSNYLICRTACPSAIISDTNPLKSI